MAMVNLIPRASRRIKQKNLHFYIIIIEIEPINTNIDRFCWISRSHGTDPRRFRCGNQMLIRASITATELNKCQQSSGTYYPS